jgi:hypothetical protein
LLFLKSARRLVMRPDSYDTTSGIRTLAQRKSRRKKREASSFPFLFYRTGLSAGIDLHQRLVVLRRQRLALAWHARRGDCLGGGFLRGAQLGRIGGCQRQAGGAEHCLQVDRRRRRHRCRRWSGSYRSHCWLGNYRCRYRSSDHRRGFHHDRSGYLGNHCRRFDDWRDNWCRCGRCFDFGGNRFDHWRGFDDWRCRCSFNGWLFSKRVFSDWCRFRRRRGGNDRLGGWCRRRFRDYRCDRRNWCSGCHWRLHCRRCGRFDWCGDVAGNGCLGGWGGEAHGDLLAWLTGFTGRWGLLAFNAFNTFAVAAIAVAAATATTTTRFFAIGRFVLFTFRAGHRRGLQDAGGSVGHRAGRRRAGVQCQLFNLGFDRSLVGTRFARWTRRAFRAFRTFCAFAWRLAFRGLVLTWFARLARRTRWACRTAVGVDRLGFVGCRTGRGRAWFALFALAAAGAFAVTVAAAWATCVAVRSTTGAGWAGVMVLTTASWRGLASSFWRLL